MAPHECTSEGPELSGPGGCCHHRRGPHGPQENREPQQHRGFPHRDSENFGCRNESCDEGRCGPHRRGPHGHGPHRRGPGGPPCHRGRGGPHRGHHGPFEHRGPFGHQGPFGRHGRFGHHGHDHHRGPHHFGFPPSCAHPHFRGGPLDGCRGFGPMGPPPPYHASW